MRTSETHLELGLEEEGCDGAAARRGGVRQPVLHHLLHRHHRDAVVTRELAQALEAGGGAVLGEHLARDRNRRKPREHHEVDGGLGVAATFEHSAGLGAEREHVTRPLELTGAGIGIDGPANGVGAVGESCSMRYCTTCSTDTTAMRWSAANCSRYGQRAGDPSS